MVAASMSTERVDALIVVALRPELEAVLAQAKDGRAGWREARDSTGAAYYVRDEINVRGQAMRIATAWLGDSGYETAESRSRQLLDELDPLCLALSGGCWSSRVWGVSIGDVVVAERVVDREGYGTEHVLGLPWKMAAADLAEDAVWRETAHTRPPSLDMQSRRLLHAIFEHENGGEPPVERSDRSAQFPRWTETVARVLQDGATMDERGTLVLTKAGREAVHRDRILYPAGLPSEPAIAVHLGTVVHATEEKSPPGVRGLLAEDGESLAIASAAASSDRRWMIVKGAVGEVAHGKADPIIADFARRAAASYLLTFLRRHLDVSSRARPPSDRPEDQTLEPLLLDRLTIAGFKNIAELTLDLSPASKLPGRWTCLAGINGSGKTSVLQAIALALLGDKLSEQLGSVRLARMIRDTADASHLAEITATVRVGAEEQALSVPLGADGIDSNRLAAYPGIKEMRALWEKRARRGILAAYGASRNLSEYLDNRHESLHLEVQRQMTLFDPQARVARAGLLLSEDPHVAPVVGTLRRILSMVLADLPVKVAGDERSLRFEIDGAVLPASALPDGFRSTVAWIGDLCALWHEKAPPEEIGDGDPASIHGIVLVDEIDLHLHPSLQRVLVPRLRAAMPRVQWIVTTHSPLVLASFDRREIKMLDSDQPGGVRELDRDILGFTTDQIYAWLMGTKPRGAVLEALLAEAERGDLDPARRDEIAALVATAPDFDEEDAKKRVAWRRGLLERLRRGPPSEGDEPTGDEKG